MTARAPEHVRQATEIHRLAMFAWLDDRERVCRGHVDGEEARDYALERPAPRYRDALEQVCAERRAGQPGNPERFNRATNVANLGEWTS